MNRKNKNIIVISIIIVLLVCLGLTIHFAKTDNYDKFDFSNNDQMMERFPGSQDNRPSSDSQNRNRRFEKPGNRQDSTTDESKDKNEDREDEKTPNNTANELESDYLVTELGQGKQKDFNNNQLIMPSNFKQSESISTKYVVLIGIETFLLGASIMYLIMNNIEREEKVVEAMVVEKDKKSGK